MPKKQTKKVKSFEELVDILLTKRPKGSKGHEGIKRDKKMKLTKNRGK